MIPRVIASRRTAGWSRKKVSAFERGQNERAFCLFIDDASLSRADLAASIIRGFVAHPLLEVFTTALTSDPRLEVEKIDGPYPEDTARVFTIGSRNYGVGFVSYASQKAEFARQYAAPGTDVHELTRRIILADHAELHGVDAFVTESRELRAMAKDGPYAGANIMHPGDGVALVGLFLRLREDFAYFHSGASSASYGKRGFYGSLARDLLPSSERWLTACPQGDPLQSSPFKLADSVLVRVERGLYARDHIHEHLLRPQGLQSDGDALFYLDAFLYSLAGAFDAIGRVVHAACSMQDSPRRANWRDQKSKANWMAELAAKAPAIADAMGPGKPHRDALELVFLLRNWIHGEGLSSVPVIEDPDRLDLVEHQLLLPPEDGQLLVNAMNRTGGLTTWGVRQAGRSLYLMDVGTYVETIFPLALAAMGAIMNLTPVEALAAAGGPSPRKELDARAMAAAERIRLLSGLGYEDGHLPGP